MGSKRGAPTAKVTQDTDSDLVATYNVLPHTAPAAAVVEAGKASYVKTFIIYGPTIWGEPTGPLFESGLAHASSNQLPLAIKTSVGRGQGGVVGEGLNIWNHAHIADGECSTLGFFSIVNTFSIGNLKWLTFTQRCFPKQSMVRRHLGQLKVTISLRTASISV